MKFIWQCYYPPSKSVLIVVAHKSCLLRLWSLSLPNKPEIVKTFRSIHVGPISCMKVWSSPWELCKILLIFIFPVSLINFLQVVANLFDSYHLMCTVLVHNFSMLECFRSVFVLHGSGSIKKYFFGSGLYPAKHLYTEPVTWSCLKLKINELLQQLNRKKIISW